MAELIWTVTNFAANTGWDTDWLRLERSWSPKWWMLSFEEGNNKKVVYRQPAPDPGASCTGSHCDWLAWHGTGLQATGAWQLKMASTFKQLVIWRLVFLVFWN